MKNNLDWCKNKGKDYLNHRVYLSDDDLEEYTAFELADIVAGNLLSELEEARWEINRLKEAIVKLAKALEFPK